MKKIAIITLNDGRQMKVELMSDCAPISVENFINLANSGYYNGLIFHRVIPNFMVQGGGMDVKMKEKGGLKPIKGEFASNGVNNGLSHTKGVLSMARTAVKNSATSQFFICVADVPHLNGEYAAFGKTIDDESAKIAVDISKVKTKRVGYYDDVPCDSIIIEKIDIIEE